MQFCSRNADCNILFARQMIRHDTARKRMRINFESIEVFVEAPAYFTVRHSIAVERGDGAGTIRDELHDCASFPDQKRKIAAVVDGPPACISEFQPGTGNICQVKKQNGFASGKLFAVERDCSDGLKPFRIFDAQVFR